MADAAAGPMSGAGRVTIGHAELRRLREAAHRAAALLRDIDRRFWADAAFPVDDVHAAIDEVRAARVPVDRALRPLPVPSERERADAARSEGG